MIRFTEQITTEEYLELRRKVGWIEFPAEEAAACVQNAYYVLYVRDDDKAIGVVHLLWDGGYVAFLSDLIVVPGVSGTGAQQKAGGSSHPADPGGNETRIQSEADAQLCQGKRTLL